MVDEILQLPYSVHEIPRTTGREKFRDRTTEDICEKIIGKRPTPKDCLSTIVQITAQSLLEHRCRYGLSSSLRSSTSQRSLQQRFVEPNPNIMLLAPAFTSLVSLDCLTAHSCISWTIGPRMIWASGNYHINELRHESHSRVGTC